MKKLLKVTKMVSKKFLSFMDVATSRRVTLALYGGMAGLMSNSVSSLMFNMVLAYGAFILSELVSSAFTEEEKDYASSFSNFNK